MHEHPEFFARMVRYQPPMEWQQWANWLAAGLHVSFQALGKQVELFAYVRRFDIIER